MAFCKYCYGLGGKYYCLRQKATPEECYYQGAPDVGKCKLYKPAIFFVFGSSNEKSDYNHKED